MKHHLKRFQFSSGQKCLKLRITMIWPILVHYIFIFHYFMILNIVHISLWNTMSIKTLKLGVKTLCGHKYVWFVNRMFILHYYLFYFFSELSFRSWCYIREFRVLKEPKQFYISSVNRWYLESIHRWNILK